VGAQSFCQKRERSLCVHTRVEYMREGWGVSLEAGQHPRRVHRHTLRVCVVSSVSLLMISGFVLAWMLVF
jgi:hypothetical protein